MQLRKRKLTRRRSHEAARFLGALVIGLLGVNYAHAADYCDAGAMGLSAGASDNSAILTRILIICAGKEIRIPAGTFEFHPLGFAQGFSVRADTQLRGVGAAGTTRTVFQVASRGTFDSMLWIRNASHVVISGLDFEGSPYDSGCLRNLDYGHAIYVYSDSESPSSVVDVKISQNAFHNFNGLSWVTFFAEDGSRGIGGGSSISIDGNSFRSDSSVGGCADQGVQYAVAMISLHGSDKSVNGMIENVSISSNTFAAALVKQAVAIWSGTARIDVRHNSIQDVGLRLPAVKGELGRYAILVYNSGHNEPGPHPSRIHITDNTIVNPVSCGVYVASGNSIQISGNFISGQIDSNDVTLPKGAIALNHAEDALVSGNDLRDNYIGISVAFGSVMLGANMIAPRPGGIRTKIYSQEGAPAEIQR
jgi:hypothetical protein